MVCPECGSEIVNVQVVQQIKLLDKHHGVLWRLCTGVVTAVQMGIPYSFSFERKNICA